MSRPWLALFGCVVGNVLYRESIGTHTRTKQSIAELSTDCKFLVTVQSQKYCIALLNTGKHYVLLMRHNTTHLELNIRLHCYISLLCWLLSPMYVKEDMNEARAYIPWTKGHKHAEYKHTHTHKQPKHTQKLNFPVASFPLSCSAVTFK